MLGFLWFFYVFHLLFNRISFLFYNVFIFYDLFSIWQRFCLIIFTFSTTIRNIWDIFGEVCILIMDCNWVFFLSSTIIYIIVDAYFVGNFGPADYRSMMASMVISVLLMGAIVISKRCSYYGLRKFKNAKKYLYFTPLILIASLNLWVCCHVLLLIKYITRYVYLMLRIKYYQLILYQLQ